MDVDSLNKHCRSAFYGLRIESVNLFQFGADTEKRTKNLRKWLFNRAIKHGPNTAFGGNVCKRACPLIYQHGTEQLATG
jgi:hypothetical protein